MANDEENTNLSRRNFLKKSGYVAGGVVGGGLIGSLLGVNFGGDTDTAVKEEKELPKFNNALMYFSNQKEFQTLADATERIYPKDDNGPGAIQLGVPYFIDHQLAGAYGYNTNEYMHGPFREGTNYQGYQSRLKRHEIFMQGIHELENQSQKEFDASFTDLDDNQKDNILSKFADNDVEMKAVKASDFFGLLLSATLSGVYADPLYGGNMNMDGWKMKEFPGNQMSYKNVIQKEDFVEMKPTALNEHISIEGGS